MISKLAADRRLGIGIDIGGTKTLVIAADCGGRSVIKKRLKTPSEIGELLEKIKLVLDSTGITQSDIIGMGVGVPGRVNSKSGLVIDVPSLKWNNINLRDQFKSYFNRPIFINNDVNLSLIGERWLGNGKSYDNLFYIAIGTGIGSAIIANGTVVEGASYSAGEIGYFIEKEDIRNGYKIAGLEFGALERKASGSALTDNAQKLGFNPRELFREYRNGNRGVTPVIEEFVFDISVAIANVVCLINPEVVIIGGGVSESMSIILNQIQDKVAEYVPIATKIVLSKLGGEAGAFGGVAYVFQKIPNYMEG